MKLLCKIVFVMKNTLLFIGLRESFYVRRWFNSHWTGLEHQHGSLSIHRFNLVPRVLSLASRKSSGCGWQHGSQNLGTKNKGGEEE